MQVSWRKRDKETELEFSPCISVPTPNTHTYISHWLYRTFLKDVQTLNEPVLLPVCNASKHKNKPSQEMCKLGDRELPSLSLSLYGVKDLTWTTRGAETSGPLDLHITEVKFVSRRDQFNNPPWTHKHFPDIGTLGYWRFSRHWRHVTQFLEMITWTV